MNKHKREARFLHVMLFSVIDDLRWTDEPQANPDMQDMLRRLKLGANLTAFLQGARSCLPLKSGYCFY
ncbi:hypothetical protein [Paraburkholderia sp. J67]|uniref:hypothetical protein n=1 Tax=Paraburkholderia sp. J67 TaxID=2805435 RepID=UPI002ABDE824|nr:hypothetical protein [Paraburkholderia sp. J67]